NILLSPLLVVAELDRVVFDTLPVSFLFFLSLLFLLEFVEVYCSLHFCCNSSHVSLVIATTIFFNQVLVSVMCAPVPTFVALASTLLIFHLLLFNCHQSPICHGFGPGCRASRFYISYISDISGTI